MRGKKWKRILIWSVSFIVLLGIGGLIAANYAVNKVISTLAADLENELKAVDKPSGDAANGKDSRDAAAEEETDKSGHASNGQDGQQGGESKEPEKPVEDYSSEISIDKAAAVQDSITVSEKASVTSVLLKQLDMSDIKILQALASGGLNQEEKKEARSIILEKLSAEQYDELIVIAQKYGLSKGKTYDQVIKEK